MVGFPQQAPLQTYSGAATPGDIAFDAPMNATTYNLDSSGTPNLVGNAFTVVSGGSPDTVSGSPNSGTAQVGGAAGSKFAGILVNSKQYASYGTSGAPLSPTLALPDNTWGSLCYFGQVWVAIDNIPTVGDLVTYDPADGSISSIPPTVDFVASSSTTTLTVASISQGQIQVGMNIGNNAGVTPGTYITALGTGKGGTGTYTINVSQSIASSTPISAPNLPAPAFSGTATASTTTLTIASVVSGQVYIGMPVNGTGFADGTVITAFGSGTGGTGTYTTNTSNTVGGAVAITATGNVLIPNAIVSHFDVTQPGLAVISMTNP